MEDEIKAIIADMFHVDESFINPDSGVVTGDIENWDSMGQLQLILKVEEFFGIKFSMHEIQNMHDFSTISALVYKKMN